MILFGGDTHKYFDVSKIETYFKNMKFVDNCNIYLILTGELGIMNMKDACDLIQFYESLLPPNVKILFVRGNHDNRAVLDSFKLEQWQGGYVHKLSDKLYHLVDGEVFEIENKKILAMGGNESRDGKFRTVGEDYHPDTEGIDEKDCENAQKNLARHNNRVNYIVAHSAYIKALQHMYRKTGNDKFLINSTAHKLSILLEDTRFDRWYTGHYHIDESFDDIIFVYDKILEDENMNQLNHKCEFVGCIEDDFEERFVMEQQYRLLKYIIEKSYDDIVAFCKENNITDVFSGSDMQNCLLDAESNKIQSVVKDFLLQRVSGSPYLDDIKRPDKNVSNWLKNGIARSHKGQPSHSPNDLPHWVGVFLALGYRKDDILELRKAIKDFFAYALTKANYDLHVKNKLEVAALHTIYHKRTKKEFDELLQKLNDIPLADRNNEITRDVEDTILSAVVLSKNGERLEQLAKSRDPEYFSDIHYTEFTVYEEYVERDIINYFKNELELREVATIESAEPCFAALEPAYNNYSDYQKKLRKELKEYKQARANLRKGKKAVVGEQKKNELDEETRKKVAEIKKDINALDEKIAAVSLKHYCEYEIIFEKSLQSFPSTLLDRGRDFISRKINEIYDNQREKKSKDNSAADKSFSRIAKYLKSKKTVRDVEEYVFSEYKTAEKEERDVDKKAAANREKSKESLTKKAVKKALSDPRGQIIYLSIYCDFDRTFYGFEEDSPSDYDADSYIKRVSAVLTECGHLELADISDNRCPEFDWIVQQIFYCSKSHEDARKNVRKML